MWGIGCCKEIRVIPRTFFVVVIQKKNRDRPSASSHELRYFEGTVGLEEHSVPASSTAIPARVLYEDGSVYTGGVQHGQLDGEGEIQYFAIARDADARRASVVDDFAYLGTRHGLFHLGLLDGVAISTKEVRGGGFLWRHLRGERWGFSDDEAVGADITAKKKTKHGG